jgi:hypothetical protein
MTSYENLLIEYEDELDVFERPMQNKGLYCDGTVWIRKDLTAAEKTCILAEEIGHHMTSFGDILDRKSVTSMKQEEIACKWAQEKLLPPEKLFEAFQAGYRSTHEIADYLGIDEKFVGECLKRYGINS